MQNLKLSSLQKEILIFFGQNKFGKNFYWTGGTLLSYHYLHHRDSVDLDFFSDNLFTDDGYLIFINELKKRIGAKKVNLTKEHNRKIYTIKRDNETAKLELVFFPFESLEKRKILKEFSVKIDTLADIMVNKILSAYQREEPKDVFDIYCYLNNKPKYNFEKLIKSVEQKFGVSIEFTLLCARMNEIADRLDSLSPLLLKPEKNLTRKVKTFLQEIFNKKAKKYLG